MNDKPNARELLKETMPHLKEWASCIRNTIPEYERELAGIASLIDRIDAYLAAPSESATETVEKIRKIFEDAACYANDDHAEYSELLKIARGNAAALIEGLQRRVPRKMLDELWDCSYGSGGRGMVEGGKDAAIDAIAAKHGVEVEK